jgi:hypothetical protein
MSGAWSEAEANYFDGVELGPLSRRVFTDSLYQIPAEEQKANALNSFCVALVKTSP